MSINPTIEISVQMFEFQKRFWWMLSSLCEQKTWQENPVPKIIITASVLSISDRYKSLTQGLIDTFSGHLDLRVKEYASEQDFGLRGALRTNDLKETEADWMFFTDADMLFHPEFFSEMSANHIDNWKGLGTLITGPRLTTDKQVACNFVDSFDYNCKKSVDNAFEKCLTINTGYSKRGRSPGAGYFQLVEVEYLKNNNINYCDRCRDASLFSTDGSGGRFVSDIMFRQKMNGITCMRKKIDKSGSRDILKPIMHLNHWRQNDKEWTNRGN